MELELRNGDYVRAGGAGLRRVDGQEALLQRVLIRLTARRGTFPFWETLGSRLWQLGRMPSGARLSAARQYVAEALAEERELTVENVSLTEYDGRGFLTVELTWQGEPLSVTLDI